MKRPVRVGIIGTGLVAREHASTIAMIPSDAVLVAAADVLPERLTQFGQEFQVERCYRSGAELISDPNVDLVTISTPPAAHEGPTVAALDGGKYVLCEKPLAHSLASARRIGEAEARHPGHLAVSYQFRYGSQFQRLAWLIKNGWVGDIQSALIGRFSFIPQTGNVWWGKWSVSGGGVLITQLIHELDMLELVMGPAVSVKAEMDTRFSDIESEDFLQATIHFAQGRSARIVAAVNSGYLGGGIEFRGAYGSVGMPEGLLLNDPQRQTKALAAVDNVLPEARNARASLLSIFERLSGRGSPEPRAHTQLYLDIVRRIERGEPLPVPSSEALRSLELCMAMYESAIRGQEVCLPLKATSLVHEGVSKSDYDSRRCVRSATVPIVFRRGDRRPRLTVRNVIVGLLKRALALSNIDPAAVRALIRKPAPVNGGLPVRRMPWPRRRHYDARERRAITRLLTKEIRSGGAIVYGGPEEDAYCAAFAKYLGGGYADAVNSGSNAVFIALRALEIEPGSEVIVPPVTDPGGMMPVVLNLCIPVPADSDPGSILTSADQICRVISDRTAAIIVSHMGGHPVDMDPILDLARARRLPVLEDCAQAHGSIYKGRIAGSIGTISAFSTMFGKQHSTGGQGGVIFTKDPILFARAKQVADRGKSFDSNGVMTNVIGSMNFNQDEMSMAIGRVQLEKLPAAVQHRRKFAALVDGGLKNIQGVQLIGDPPGCESSYWYLMVRLDPAIVSWNAEDFAKALVSEGIEGVYAGYSVYPTDQFWHRKAAVFGRSGLPWSLNQQRPREYQLPNAHEANRRMVRIEIHESLGQKEARDIIAAIRKVAQYCRA
jgi:perosamine synthetase